MSFSITYYWTMISRWTKSLEATSTVQSIITYKIKRNQRYKCICWMLLLLAYQNVFYHKKHNYEYNILLLLRWESFTNLEMYRKRAKVFTYPDLVIVWFRVVTFNWFWFRHSWVTSSSNCLHTRKKNLPLCAAVSSTRTSMTFPWLHISVINPVANGPSTSWRLNAAL